MTRLGQAFAHLLTFLVLASSGSVRAQAGNADAGATQAEPRTTELRSGLDVYRDFREGLAQPECSPDASARWRTHFAAAPKRLANEADDLLPLFAYVVDAVRAASLPTEYALIPFVESGYKPGARSPLGPAGLWQMIAVTARNHKVPIRNGYDGRLSPVDSTRAAVRYLKTLHGMFAGDWRLAAMAYNAGEYRIFGSLRRAGQVARDATPAQLPGLAPITHAYVRKLHALSCLLSAAEENHEWLRAIDRPVAELTAMTLPPDIRNIERWASRNGQDTSRLRRLNPVLTGARPGSGAMQLLVVTAPSNASGLLSGSAREVAQPVASKSAAVEGGDAPSPGKSETQNEVRRHTVVRGDTLSGVASRYGVRVSELVERNELTMRSIIRPGHVLNIDSGERAIE
ncbi:MAG: transglycosylase SLT domain-containing protein [Pseudomonadota bacterium]|nr:transglycosylase SLT domain-containing protein [Pseudomonadota bacterium]